MSIAQQDLPERLQAGEILHLEARISHVRTGPLRHAFRYRSDLFLFSPEAAQESRGLLRRNGLGLFSLRDGDHGPAADVPGGAAQWVRDRLQDAGKDVEGGVLGLLTQPRWLGLLFNPVSFWILWQQGRITAYLAEVNNTYGQRHFYLCQPSAAKMGAKTSVRKMFHVSPFQDVAGRYDFRLSANLDAVDLLICHQGPESGLIARMQGPLRPLRQRRLLASAITRPGGALRILGLIYFEALRLKLRGAAFRRLPPAPISELSE